jgi:predicted O-linked N-acetylglucosamine transferase (SPINDLY family)
MSSDVFFMVGSGSDHIGRKAGACNVALDVHHYNGHSNSVDALWAGLPTVTFPGEDWAARATSSFLYSLDATEL